MEQKIDFIKLAIKEEISFLVLCKRFGISRPTGYKWLKRFRSEGEKGLLERSKRPHLSPRKVSNDLEDLIIELRDKNPEWGAKKLHRLLINMRKEGKYPSRVIPARSTINQVLKRNGRISKHKTEQSKHWKRFEYPTPNALWQMDFKGYFSFVNKKLCHPLTIVDDHSRYNVGLIACKNQQYSTVINCLEEVFEQYGLPDMMLTDNGSPWGNAGNYPTYNTVTYTKIKKWLIQHQVKLIHGRPWHPQTQGKEERFHRTLKVELLQYRSFKDYKHCQEGFDQWRFKYNHQRPHEAIDFDFPAERYHPSLRSFKKNIEKPEYPDRSIIKRVDRRGIIYFNGKHIRVGKAFYKDELAIIPVDDHGSFKIMYYDHKIRDIKL